MKTVALKALAVGLCSFISGAGLGWLIGLSVAPVIQGVITALLTLAVAVVTALVGLKAGQIKTSGSDLEGVERPPADKPEELNPASVFPLPMACLLIGLAGGASLGITARTNHWLAPNPASFVERWKKTGLTEAEIARRLFDQEYPPTDSEARKGAEANAVEKARLGNLPFLFNHVSASEYSELRAADAKQLYRIMIASQNPRVRAFAEKCGEKNADCLKAAVDELIQPETAGNK